MVPKLPADLPKDRQSNMLASVKIDSASATCPAGMDHRLISQPSSSAGASPVEQSSLPDMSYFNVDDFLNTIDRLSDSLNDSNGGLNGEQFMNLADVSHVGPLCDTYLTGSQDLCDIQCKVVVIEPDQSSDELDMEDSVEIECLRELQTGRNGEQVEAAVLTVGGGSTAPRGLARKRSMDIADPTLASMFYPGNACLEPLAKKVRIVESGSSAYLEWFSSTDTSVQHLAASDMLEVLKLPKDNAFASWVAFNTEKSTEKKEDVASNCSSELSARLAGYDFETSPRRVSESSDYDLYWMSNSDDYLSSAPPSEDEIDVVSVPTAQLSPESEDDDDDEEDDNLSSWDILPASTHMSEHVADLHSYSSRPAPRPSAPARCLVTAGSASAPPSPVQRVAPAPAKRCVSNPASPQQRVPARHRKRRGMQSGGRGRMKIDKDCLKRAQHNVLERERRLQLTQQFVVLRVQVPSIRSNERASKSDILNGARSYIIKLRQQRTEFDETLERETRINAQLRKTLNEAMRLCKYGSKKGVN